MLDIRAGDGSLLAYLKRTHALEPLTIGIPHKVCEPVRQKGIKVLETEITLDHSALPQADHIVMSAVLEHLPNPEAVLSRVKGKFNRFLLVDIPNTGALDDRLPLLLGRRPKQSAFHAGEHLRFWTVTDSLFLCRRLGYRVEPYYRLYDFYYQLGLKLWRSYPQLFARYVVDITRRQD